MCTISFSRRSLKIWTLSEWISGVADLRRVLITQSCLEDTISFTAVSVLCSLRTLCASPVTPTHPGSAQEHRRGIQDTPNTTLDLSLLSIVTVLVSLPRISSITHNGREYGALCHQDPSTPRGGTLLVPCRHSTVEIQGPGMCKPIIRSRS